MSSLKPNNEKFREIFDKIAPNFDKISNEYTVARRAELISQWAEGKCLDIGAGTGEISKSLIKNHYEVIAADSSRKMVSEIKKKLKIQAIVCDAEKLLFPNNNFDTVIASELIY